MSEDPNIIEISESRALITATWDDVPHLSEDKKRQLMASMPAHMKDARARGIPSIGAGAIYPVPRETIECAPFAIPDYWKRCYAMDVGWKVTAAIWFAEDPMDGVRYAYAEYFGQSQTVEMHAMAIKARGAWIRGCIDPAARQRNQADGTRLMTSYQQAGLNLVTANNAVETGINALHSRMVQGRFKAFSTLTNFWREIPLYRREIKTNELGVQRAMIVKKDDHIMDCARYCEMKFYEIAGARPIEADATPSKPVSNLAGY